MIKYSTLISETNSLISTKYSNTILLSPQRLHSYPHVNRIYHFYHPAMQYEPVSRCTTFTKFPVALSAGNNENLEPVAACNGFYFPFECFSFIRIYSSLPHPVLLSYSQFAFL
jgi:hypothetical protein